MHFKDAILDSLANHANIAQFVSFDPDLCLRYNRIFSFPPNSEFENVRDAVSALLNASAEGSVNVRSFDPQDPKSREFVYGLRSVDAADATIRRLAVDGLHTIVNETIDVKDGGVSGVALGDVLEFAPGETPRCVEQPGTASLSRDIGLSLLETVYGFRPALDFGGTIRVEFSIHPLRRGVRNEHTIIWETEEIGRPVLEPEIRWPNKFSRFIGDKAFGLLVAHLYGLPVPRTTVVGRNAPPFTFGRGTRTNEPWIRTAPVVQMPGKFTTHRGWLDPFTLMTEEDPQGTAIASVLAQEGIAATFSGAVVASSENSGKDSLIIEGTRGFGDEFMVGKKARVELPSNIRSGVRRLYTRARRKLGPVRMEWVADEKRIWVVQFHRGQTVSSGNVIVPGKPKRYQPYEVSRGLEGLRALIEELVDGEEGIELIGDVGITSHFGDILRRANIPSRITSSIPA